ncbi:MAG TPA: ABC transporter permease subunit [Gemmatimonadaceae bacterium]|nr:ABC transporter permease subunit [Gemmatimonadaceae bacterium]
MTNLLGRLFNQHARILIATALLLAGFEVLMCALVASTDINAPLRAFLRSLSPSVRGLAGSVLPHEITPLGRLLFAWNHPVVHVLLGGTMILFASGAVAGEIEGGTLELVLAQPISRRTYLATHIVFATTAVAVLGSAMLCGTALGLAVFDLHRVAQWQSFLPVALNLIALEVAIFAVTLLGSVSLRSGGKVAMGAMLFVAVSYTLDGVARLWKPMGFILPYTVFDYYSPFNIVVRHVGLGGDLLVLTIVWMVMIAGAWFVFARRDIP